MPSALRPLQLRSSSAHCVRKLKSWQGGSGHGSGGRVVEEEEDEEEKKKKKKEEEENNSDKI